MKKLLLFFSFMLLSYGFINAQKAATLRVTLEATNSTDVNNKKPIPSLKTDEEWTVTATTLYKGVTSGYWGSRLFSIQMDNSTEEFSGFEFFIRPQEFSSSAGLIGVNNKYGQLNTEPLAIDAINGTEITFEITSDGTGLITATVLANDNEWTIEKTVDPAVIPYYDFVQAAQNYDVEIEIEYFPEFLSVSPSKLDFGAYIIGGGGSMTPKIISVLGSADYTEEITYTIKTEEGIQSNFHVLPETFTKETGGEFNVYFVPEGEESLGNQKIIVTFTRGDESKTVEITGYGAPKAPIEADTWYRIQFSERTGYFLTDKGADTPLEATMYDATGDNQLWKFESVSDGNYKMVSKTGRNIGYRYPSGEDDDADAVPGRFIAVASSNNTFSFEVSFDGDWQILWNEYETENEDGTKEYTGAHLNKTNNDSQITAYKALPSEGSILEFYKENERVDDGLPQFSTDTDEYWYYIQFARVKSIKDFAVLSSEEVDMLIIQEELDRTNELFKWKFLGNAAECLIVDVNGNAWSVNSDNKMNIVDISEGNSFKFEGYHAKSWQLYNLTADNEQKYVNDFGGTGTEVGQWSIDAGSEILFIPVDGVNINNPVTDENDPVVNTTYYTIEGLQLGSQLPSVQGIYIEKSTHTSKKVSARKIFVGNNKY